MSARRRAGICFVLLEWSDKQYSISIESFDTRIEERGNCTLYAPLEEHVDPKSGECFPPKVRFKTVFYCDKLGGRHMVELLVSLLNTPAAKQALNKAVNDFCHALLENKIL